MCFDGKYFYICSLYSISLKLLPSRKLTPMHVSAINGSTEVMELLIKAGAEVFRLIPHETLTCNTINEELLVIYVAFSLMLWTK